MSNSSDKFVLVVGATGATGKFVVQNLLDQRRKVKVIVRSETKLMNLLKEGLESNAEFVVKEAPSLLGLKDDELTSFVGDCDTIVQCLGHNITYQGMYKDGYFVSGAVEKLTTIMPDGCRFILMGSDGVAHPDGKTDPKRTLGERCVYFLLRCLVPPHVDNEKAALYLYEKCSNRKDWVVVRPTNLIDVDVADGKYENFTSQQVSPIFGDREVSRANVAHFMTQLVTDKRLFEKYNHSMPIIYNIKTTDRGSKESKKAK
jgi:nucleoside-diphosphate-sugar epimerase